MEKSFEQSLVRLEQIAALLENGSLPLEESLKLFSEGTALISACSKYLDTAEQKITKLLDNGEEDVQNN